MDSMNKQLDEIKNEVATSIKPVLAQSRNEVLHENALPDTNDAPFLEQKRSMKQTLRRLMQWAKYKLEDLHIHVNTPRLCKNSRITYIIMILERIKSLIHCYVCEFLNWLKSKPLVMKVFRGFVTMCDRLIEIQKSSRVGINPVVWKMIAGAAIFYVLALMRSNLIDVNNLQVWWNSKQVVVRPAFTPLTISFHHKSCTYEACPFTNIKDDGSDWIELARSKIIKDSDIQKHSSAQLKFTWSNDRWGKGNQMLRVRLVHEVARKEKLKPSPWYSISKQNDHDRVPGRFDETYEREVASSPLYIIGPNSEETMYDCFDIDSRLVKYGLEGSRYVVEVLPEKGRYFNVAVRNFEFRATSSFMREDMCTL